MTANAEEPLSREERFARTTNRLTLAYAAAFGAWQLADMLHEGSDGRVRAIWLVISLSAWLAWMALLVVLMRSTRRIKKDPKLRAVMQDERARDVRLRAYRIGFWAIVGVAALLGVPAAAHLIPAYAVAKLIVVIGVATFLVTTVVLDRE